LSGASNAYFKLLTEKKNKNCVYLCCGQGINQVYSTSALAANLGATLTTKYPAEQL